MLSLCAKTAALYPQGTKDSLVDSVVSELEQLTANLSGKIWQKISKCPANRCPTASPAPTFIAPSSSSVWMQKRAPRRPSTNSCAIESGERNMPYRTLNLDKIIETAETLQRRISERFPGSGLSGVCRELVDVARASKQRVVAVSRPPLSSLTIKVMA